MFFCLFHRILEILVSNFSDSHFFRRGSLKMLRQAECEAFTDNILCRLLFSEASRSSAKKRKHVEKPPFSCVRTEFPHDRCQCCSQARWETCSRSWFCAAHELAWRAQQTVWSRTVPWRGSGENFRSAGARGKSATTRVKIKNQRQINFTCIACKMKLTTWCNWN